ncbi:unnamed protein product [Amoebophrya sp. A25]|nr:unnamed protein product [Amoebophrya sp. A25]|eukprot:GSA25T00017894001.1
MIDDCVIFTKTGVVLFRAEEEGKKADPLDAFIKTVLVQEQLGDEPVTVENYKFHCRIRNDLELVFVLIYQGILQLAYLETLLAEVTEAFVGVVEELNKPSSLEWRAKNLSKFRKIYDGIKLRADREWLTRKKEMRSFQDTERGKSKKDGAKGDGGDEDDDDDGGRGKKKREWTGAGKVNKQAIDKLDFSKKVDPADGGRGDDDQLAAAKAQFLADDDEEEAEILRKPKLNNNLLLAGEEDTGILGRLKSGLKNFTGGKVLTQQDLEPLLKPIREQLLNKNVAKEVADRLLDSVRQSLVGSRTEAWSTMRQTVHREIVRAVSQLLTPKKSVDVMRAAMAAKANGRVFSIAFIGVNGVGKSTNLAKVAYHLKKQGGLSILIAACDTFRAGAVEQLKTHARCLDVELFEKGYGKDPAEIAKNAIRHAEKENIDVVLIDTAGRMQGNESLMREIAKMVSVNQPDLVLFVGEALTGNDGIDQVKTFNRSLIDLSPDRNKPRGIDGLLLTKYDTVDDKVGAALSMVYVSGQPVVFVGTGQKYPNLRKLHVEDVCNALLS